jgi:hypothetical protein
MDDGYALYVVAFFLIWASAAALFICLRLLDRFSLTKVVLRFLAAFVAVVGFPLASLYSGEGRMPFLEVELVVAAVCLGIWTYQKWRLSGHLNLFLLFLHFLLWALFSKFPYLCCLYLWPDWIWRWGATFGDKMRFVYPLLGFCSTLIWAAHFRAPGAT